MNEFIQCLQSSVSGKAPLGSFVMSGSHIIAEAMGHAGFDWLILDGEHSPIDIADIARLLQAVGNTPAHAIVRVPWNEPIVVKRVLDAGANTLLFPFIESADEARLAVRATRYPPEGIRGMAGLSRASKFGSLPNYFATANDQIGVIVQLESLGAIAQLEHIASVPGVNALFLGPTDLSGSMGHFGNAEHLDVQQALRTAASRCRSLGTPVGTVAATTELAHRYRDMGFDFVGVASDLGLMLSQARNQILQYRHPATNKALAPNHQSPPCAY